MTTHNNLTTNNEAPKNKPHLRDFECDEDCTFVAEWYQNIPGACSYLVNSNAKPTFSLQERSGQSKR